ncbi:MAG: heme exporter protein CcmB [Armatimonadetes bacterium]|nr:heme exporter protein CcmB [Armatimonadota bacterium]
METTSSGWLKPSAAVLVKDCKSELRTRYALNAILLFAITTLAIISGSMAQYGAKREMMAALLWVVLFFSAMSGLSRSFVREEETRTITALRLTCRPAEVYAGKLTFNLALMLALDLIVIPGFLFLMQVEVGNSGLLALVILLGSIGLGGASTLVAAIISKAGAKSALFPVLAFPILLPLFIIAIEATEIALTGKPALQALSQLRFLVTYAVVTITVSLMLFDFVWNE